MNDIGLKLVKRIVKRGKKFNIIRFKTKNFDFFGCYDIDINKGISTYDAHWIIDAYLLTFCQYLDENKVKSALEFLNSLDNDNLIIGMNMLYKIKIKSIN